MKKMEKLNKATPRRNASEKEPSIKMTKEQIKNFREYQRNYVNVTYRQYSIRFRADTDADVIAFLDDAEKVPNLTNYLRRVILAEIYKDDPREKDLNGRPYEVIAEFDKKKHENALLTKQQIGRGL